MSQARIILVSRYLGISSALYLLKRLFRSRLACLRGLTASTEGHRRDCHPTLSPKTHIHPKPCGLYLDQGKSLCNCSSSSLQGGRMAAPSSSPPFHVSYPLCLLSRLPVSPAREPGRVDAVPGHRECVRRGQPTAGCGMGISSARSSWLISRRCAQGSSRGSSWQKPRVAKARNVCRGAAPPCSQNNQGQNRRHEAKSHRERLLRLSCTSDLHGRSGAGQHLASIPAADTVPASSHTSPEEQLQQPGVQRARTLGVSQVRLILAKKMENFPTCAKGLGRC